MKQKTLSFILVLVMLLTLGMPSVTNAVSNNSILYDLSAPETDDVMLVRFTSDPEDAEITVYDSELLDENREPQVVLSQKEIEDDPNLDKVYLLKVDHLYYYDVTADGYVSVEKEELKFCADDGEEGELTIEIALEQIEESDPEAGESQEQPLRTALAITEQPVNAVAEVGETVTFHIAVQGDNVTYQWQFSKNGTTWSNSSATGNKTDTLSFQAASTYNGRQFRCVVSNGTDTIVSDAVTFTIGVKLAITAQPENVIAASGETVSFHIAVQGDNVTYQWQFSKNGTTWSNSSATGNKTDTLSFQAASTYNGRQFRCVVSDGTDTIISDVVSFTIGTKLTITTQPESVTAAPGETVSFHVAAQGANITYRWQYSSNGTTWSNSSATGCNTDTISFTALMKYNGRQFRCIVSDGTESVISAAVVLTVRLSLAITAQPENVTVAPGETATFHVVAQGENVTYRWQYSKDGTTWTNSSATGSRTDTLSFTAGNSLNGRQFRCIVSDGTNTIISTAATLTVKVGLEIVSQPEDVDVEPDEIATFHIVAQGENVTYRWQFSKNNGSTWSNSSAEGSNTDTLSFEAKSAYDGRLFRCVVSDGTETIISQVATLTVRIKLEVISQPENSYTELGQTASFHVEVKGDGVTFQWQYFDTTGNRWVNSKAEGFDTGTLSFTALLKFNGRQFRCVITDGTDTLITNVVSLTIKQQLEIITQPVDVQAAEGEIVTLHVQVKGDDVSYQWQYSKNGVTWYDCKAAGANTDTFSFVMQRAYNGRKYRCVVTDHYNTTLETLAATVTLDESGLEIGVMNFPDEQFRAYLSANFDLNSNGFLSGAEINAITVIDCSSMEIASLAGIENFVMLNTLIAENNDLVEVDLSQNTALVTFRFRNNPSLTTVTLPNSITTIPDNAFNGCTSLASMVIPDAVTSIGVSAFEDCTALVTVTMSNGVSTIGRAAFKNCIHLKSIVISDASES